MDTRTPEQRSRIMRAVRTRNTGPEMKVRQALHRLGYRFRLHRRDLPGRPDVVLPKHRLAIFVHGCYWHGHACSKGRPPKSNQSYWGPKLSANQERDRKAVAALCSAGWRVGIIWQCEVGSREELDAMLLGLIADRNRSTFQV